MRSNSEQQLDPIVKINDESIAVSIFGKPRRLSLSLTYSPLPL